MHIYMFEQLPNWWEVSVQGLLDITYQCDYIYLCIHILEPFLEGCHVRVQGLVAAIIYKCKHMYICICMYVLEQLREGCRVSVQGLVAAAKYNGMLGNITGRCVYMSTHIHMHTHTHTHTWIHIRAHTRTHAYVFMCVSFIMLGKITN